MNGWLGRGMRLAMVSAIVCAGTQAAVAQAPSQGLSDESVRKLMNYAWQQTPPRFTKPDSSVVEIDLKKPETVTIPLEAARDIIVAARRSALAQMCKLDEHEIANYRSLMLREVQKKKWSEQQIVYINVLHLTTVQIFAGDLTIKVKDDGGKVVEETPVGNKRTQTCTDAEATKVKEQIETYVAQGPSFEAPGAAPTTTGSAAKTPPATDAAKATPTTPAAAGAQKK